MSAKKKKRRPRSRLSSPPPCTTLGSDDGIDPRKYFQDPVDRARDDRKTRQLSRQVAHALQLALAGECGDARLQALEVVAVEPAPDASRLRVVLRSFDPQVEIATLTACVAAVAGRLRTATAAAIRRRRAPDLVFLVVPPEGTP